MLCTTPFGKSQNQYFNLSYDQQLILTVKQYKETQRRRRGQSFILSLTLIMKLSTKDTLT